MYYEFPLGIACGLRPYVVWNLSTLLNLVVTALPKSPNNKKTHHLVLHFISFEVPCDDQKGSYKLLYYILSLDSSFTGKDRFCVLFNHLDLIFDHHMRNFEYVHN